MQELQGALDTCKATSPGHDRISHLMMKNLPPCAKEYMLNVFKKIWRENYFFEEYRLATVIPIPKPGKDHTDPLSFRPRSLSSCICKLYEKMVNNRLHEFLENKLLAGTQCGFRRNRATNDHLVLLDTYIRKGMEDGKRVASVFFDLEKACDWAWRYGILKDMHVMGLRGRLPSCIGNFMRDREFHVRISTTTSGKRRQNIGVPQGSTLSVTLFAIEIKSLAKEIPPHIFNSIFVDDLQVAYSDSNVYNIQKELQNCIYSIANWAEKRLQVLNNQNHNDALQ